MSDATKTEALKILDGIQEVAKNEMLVFGYYLSEYVERTDLEKEGAICGGHTACLIGSAYIAAGVKPRRMDYPWVPAKDRPKYLPGLGTRKNRERYLRNRPALKLAIDSLNEAAKPRVKKYVWNLREFEESWGWSPAEGLFEYYDSDLNGQEKDVVYPVVRLLVRSAKRIVEKS